MSKDNKAVNSVHEDYTNIFQINCYTYIYKDYTQEKVENTIYPLYIGLVLILY